MRASLRRLGPAAVSLPLILASGGSFAEETQGLPQLDVHSYSSQLFWLVVFFGVVYLFMRFVGVPRVAAIIEERRSRIGADIGAAERLRAEAAEARRALEATMAEAHGAARKLLAETHERNVAILTDRTRAATAEFDHRVGEAVQRIDAARDEAFSAIPGLARDLTSEITAKLLGRRPGPDSVARAVNDAVGREAA
jgi:F-type H+-transporting ATPase subunit b